MDGRGFFTELEHQLAYAKRGVDVQVYIFDNDDIAVRYADRLKQCARHLKVRVLMDDLGSTTAISSAPLTPGPRGIEPPASMLSYLKDGSNVRARRSLNPWLVCDHTKLFVIDQRTALLGGMNIGREYYSEWHDLMLRVEGPIVADFSSEYEHAWRSSAPLGGLSLFRKKYAPTPPPQTPDCVPIRLLRTDSSLGKHHVYEATLLALRSAKKRIWIENPYFAHDGITAEVCAAAKRGIDVRVILPKEGDSAIMDSGNLATANQIIQAGGKAYRYPRMTHMKVMICDDWAQAGSANLDTLSMRINRELNIGTADAKTVSQLERLVFKPDFRVSRRIKLQETESVVAPIAEALADQL